MKNHALHILIFSALVGLAACGGGGADSSSAASNPAVPTPADTGAPTLTPSAADPNTFINTATASFDLRWGRQATSTVLASPADVQIQVIADKMAIQLEGTAVVVYPAMDWAIKVNEMRSLGKTESAMQSLWIAPEVKAAWAQGWTGFGVKTGIIDDFTPSDASEFLRLNGKTGCKPAALPSGNATLCSTQSVPTFSLTHGDQVSLIVGGTKSVFAGKSYENGSFTATGDSGIYSGLADVSVNFSKPFYGVAKDAQVVRSDFLTYQQHTNGLFSILKEWGAGTDQRSQLYNERKVINLSLSTSGTDPVVNKRIFDTQLPYASTSTTPDAVFVKAAGNASCVASEPDCDPINAVFQSAPAYKGKTLLVGALDQAGGRLASYSNTAGTYADRFVVADGRGTRVIDGTYEVGTSFAAPRVAGYVAIVRQKFPNLSAADAAKLILDTAVWNPAWGAKTPATQAIYGQGEANLARALAPVGALR